MVHTSQKGGTPVNCYKYWPDKLQTESEIENMCMIRVASYSVILDADPDWGTRSQDLFTLKCSLIRVFVFHPCHHRGSTGQFLFLAKFVSKFGKSYNS